MDEISRLISAHCDDDLDAAQSARLAEWLRESEANVDRFTREFALHSRLCDLLNQQQQESDAWGRALGEDDPVADAAEKTPRPHVTLRRWVLPTLAIAGAIAVVMGFAAFSGERAIVAQVSAAQASVFDQAGAPVAAGSLVRAGALLRVERGAVLLTFENGARVRLDGPAEFTVDSRDAGSLHRGQAAARVPTPAVGFAIHTPVADVIDLGTEFQLDLVDDRLKLTVFDGLVEVQPSGAFPEGPLQISEGRTTLFDADAGRVLTLDYDESDKRDTSTL